MRILIFLTTSFLYLSSYAQVVTVTPGDASNNGEVTNVDLLHIGINYGLQGPPRDSADQNIIFTPYQTLSWQGNPIGPVNPVHSDCDGNGTINTFDSDAIVQNYGMTRAQVVPETYNTSVSGATPLSLRIVPDSLTGGSVAMVTVEIGGNQFVDSLYGIAFSIRYDSSVVDCVFASFNGSILAGGGVAPLSYYRDDRDRGMIDIAITRINRTNIAAAGAIGTVGIVMDDNLKTWGTLSSMMNLDLVNVLAIDNQFGMLPLEHISDSVTILSGRKDARSTARVAVYPQPAQSYIMLRSTESIRSYKIWSLEGRCLKAAEISGSLQHRFSTKGLSSGIYLLEVHTRSGVLRKKIMVQ